MLLDHWSCNNGRQRCTLSYMTQSPVSADVPTWTIGDRLGKALNHAGISVGEMATYLGLSRNSVSAYINDRAEPKRQTLLLWAMRTGVALEWLETGEHESGPTPPDGAQASDAVAKLVDQKRGRSGRRPTTLQYFAPALVAA